MKLRSLLLFAAITLTLSARSTIPRSSAARREFMHEHPCPATGKQTGACPGWIVDHVIALACGGPDEPANMAWQTVEDAKTKDKWERKDCRLKKLDLEPRLPGF